MIFISTSEIRHHILIPIFSFLSILFFPDGRASRDTVEIFLADKEGKWLGEGSGNIYDNRVLFKRNVIFPLSGTYRFEVEQAMRQESLPEIMDVGFTYREKAELKPSIKN
jgi:gliding motility-associated lipoprotein GldH